MSSDLKTIGVVGLGGMGGNLARQALDKGYGVVGFQRSGAPADLREQGMAAAEDMRSLASQLEKPRKVLLYVPAGPSVDRVVADLVPHLEAGDIIVDGGNSYWGDSAARAKKLKEEHGLHLLDVGTSGGISGAREGASFMGGGDPEAFEHLRPIFEDLAVKGGVVYCGEAGTGHFVKLVHNGIEFGMLQAIGEGVALLERFPSDLDIEAILENWRYGSVIRSWLIDLMAEGYRERKGLNDVPGWVEDTGEVNWLVSDAMELEVPTPIIAASVMQLLQFRDEKNITGRAVALMRHGFGGHPFGRVDKYFGKRHESRIGEFVWLGEPKT